MQKAVLDRLEGHMAVFILAETDEIINMPRSELKIKISEGDHVLLIIEDDVIQQVELDADSTEAARESIKAQLERLRRGDHLKKKDEE